jgi:hypothetical protein
MGYFKNKVLFFLYSICPKSIAVSGIELTKYLRALFSNQLVSEKAIINFGCKDKHVFFGYYDIAPFDESENFLLAMCAPLIDRAPDFEDEAEVGYYYLNNLEHGYVSLGRTNTWCWQQGCRLQWYGEGNKQIIYNCLVDGKYGAVIKEIDSGKIVREIKKPLYSISKGGKWGLSLDFSRLQRLRPGYGYSTLKDESQGELVPKRGIDLVNMETGDFHKVISLYDIKKIEPHKSMDGAEHYFNHLMFNPSGTKFIFYHLWNKNGKRYSRIFVADRDGSNIKILNNSGKSSHYNWISDDKIILYSYIEEIKKYSFAIFDIEGKKFFFGEDAPERDGHPTYLNDLKIFITDTYPDLYLQRNLLAYKLKENKVIVLARFDSLKHSAKEFSCDLHPRVSNSKKMICVDRIINKKRNISIIPFNADFL